KKMVTGTIYSQSTGNRCPRQNRGRLSPFFITATDTHVGKTVVTYVLGVLLKERGIDVGVMKPVQCGGRDAQFLRESLGLKDSLALINPIYAPEPLSPHLALRRAKKKFDLKKVK